MNTIHQNILAVPPNTSHQLRCNTPGVIVTSVLNAAHADTAFGEFKVSYNLEDSCIAGEPAATGESETRMGMMFTVTGLLLTNSEESCSLACCHICMYHTHNMIYCC